MKIIAPVKDFVARWPMHTASIICLAVVVAISPQQIGNLFLKACVIFGAGCLGYWVNQWRFGRSDNDWQECALMCAAMIAAGIAV